MPGLYGISVGALNNAMTGVYTAGHNISNANTPGYSRQTIEQTTNDPLRTGAGFIGQGATVGAITRLYDGFLTQQVRQANSQAMESSTYLAQMQSIDRLLSDPNAGLSPALTAFFKGVQEVAAKPADIAARQSMLSSAQSLEARFKSINTQFTDLRAAVNTDIQASVTHINALTRQIATMNDQIALLSANAAAGQQPNDLLDKRDTMVLELNKEIRADVVLGGDGSYGLFSSTGQPLVLGNLAYTLSTVPDADNPTDTQVTVALGSSSMRLRAQDLSGGKLGGSLAFRQGGLTDAQNALGRLAIAMTESVNDQHRLGQDLNGALGGVLFTATNSANPNIVYPNSANTGAGVVTASVTSASGNYGLLTASDYRLTYTALNTYSLTRLSDNTVTALTTAGLPATVDGVTISVPTTPAIGDQFMITPTRYGAAQFSVALTDVRKIAAATPISTAAGLSNAGSGTVSAGTVNAPPPTNANLQQPVTITFTSATTFDVTGVGTLNPVGVAYTAGANITYNGWTIQINGTPGVNDTFTVGPNANGLGDNRNARAIGQMQMQGLMGRSAPGATGITYGEAYGQIVSQVGNKSSQLQVNSDSLKALAAAAEKSQNAVSGVNLDEEASNLMRYQQVYQAAGKMVSIAGVLFDTILNIR